LSCEKRAATAALPAGVGWRRGAAAGETESKEEEKKVLGVVKV